MGEKRIATIAVHGGDQVDKGHRAIIPPITTASSFIQENIGEYGEHRYSRVSNPTRYAYETALAELEGGVFATATASGMAATSLAVELLDQNSHVIVMTGAYGGTFRLFEQLSKRTSGTEVEYLNLNKLEAVEAAVKENTALIWIETPTNPLLELVDIAAVCELAKKYGIRTCVDNTFASAWNQRPIELGADMVMLSTSKYIGGHSDVIGGALITGDPELAKCINFIKTTVGAIASPFDAYLALRGMKTLDVRMQRHCENAQIIAEYLETHPKVLEVYYPGLKSHPQHELCKKQMRSGGPVVSLRLKGDLDTVKAFVSKCKYFVLAESLGGVESMLNHSATMSHSSMPKEERESVGIHDTTLRLSVGIEAVEDLIEDLKNALN
ncbi:PLP-dependent aspartate aminotransferase family protein [Pseudovibrio sp. Tun.PSC04-5.I4]|uniref:trans-sulfuration enzyme family protein n=1 Tax=Pseudovibrio sp. Tun.PSC04-5.I4 TaxID=1798213 RepID=UPI00088426DB|nr:PLP-dependent aspartate aminotransferase family protein [Pseudovibrio sp. Tun.PSC04-5.I4]SDQ14058.1 cystathionine gamma-lyase [Pseudovibrio sp. Tun.PSC04-5.I4]